MPTADLTGRDGYIIARALATTYALIGSMPAHCQEDSNRHDIARLLRVMLGAEWKVKAHDLRHVISEAEWSRAKAPLRRDSFEEPA
jgi:hypothetical protein